ncbi:DR2241 family protein [Haloarculaceae archaeon H-GB11]|nr:DR2241 family protein [Haloarculaceae archaeon H-GB11]
MDDDVLDSLWLAADHGVSFDGLHVDRTDETVHFETPADDATVTGRAAFEEVATEHAAYVSNWFFWHERAPTRDDHWAFCRWLEGASETPVSDRHAALDGGVTRSWGQLELTVSSTGFGERRYALRHEADADEPLAPLTRYDDPLAARQLVKHDGDGRYRPLKTATNLPTGWVFDDLLPEAMLETVEYVYPATIANWYRERKGDLDVTHWRETAARQTGIYGLVSDLDDEAVGWLAEACCVDSQCCKRREWDLDDESDLDVPRGEGAFPCREPCSLVVAAARTVTKLEREATETYELELTPSEKAQLETLVDAVAEDRLDEIREADFDDGANRYRVRYLRAKLFGDGLPDGHS